LISMKK